jgi:hypothetical protein
MGAGLDVEPERAVGIGPLVLQVAFLAIGPGAVRSVGKPRTPVLGGVAAHAAGGPGNDSHRLQVAMAITALEALMGAHQRKAGFAVMETDLLP